MRTAIVAEQIQKKKEKRRNMALFIELLLMGVGLAMDAFAVSVCKGLGMKKLNKKQKAALLKKLRKAGAGKKVKVK